MSESTHGLAAVAVLAGSMLLAGCGGWVTTGNAAYGPYPSTDEAALFERVVDTVRARGYEVLDADATRGHFAVRSHAIDPRRGRTIFRFRFYRGGWVGVEPIGGGTRRTYDGQVLMTVSLHEEYGRLVTGLTSTDGERR